MAISNETKRAIRQQIEVLNTQKKIAQGNLSMITKQVSKLSARVANIDTAIMKLETDLVG